MSACFICEGKFCQGALENDERYAGKKLEVCQKHHLVQCVHGLARSGDCCTLGGYVGKCISLCRVNGCTNSVPLFLTGKHSYRLNPFVGSHSRCPKHYKNKACFCGNRLSRLGFGNVCVGCSKVVRGPPTLLLLMALRRHFDSEITSNIMRHLQIIQKAS